MDCSPPDSSVHGISQARILEWVAISFSRGSSWPRDQTWVSCIGRQILYCQATREASPLLPFSQYKKFYMIIPEFWQVDIPSLRCFLCFLDQMDQRAIFLVNNSKSCYVRCLVIPFFILSYPALKSSLLVLFFEDEQIPGKLFRDLLPTFWSGSQEIWEMEKWWCCLHKNPNRMGFGELPSGVAEWMTGPETPGSFPHTLPYASLPSECLSISLISFYNKLFTWVALATCSSKFCELLRQTPAGSGVWSEELPI